MNANVIWNRSTQMVIAKHSGDTIRLGINADYATINNRRVNLDTPATLVNGRTMVPLRFLSEALGASVYWVASTRTVEITTGSTAHQDGSQYTMVRNATGTVVPVRLNEELSSNGSDVGDKFTATIDTNGSAEYQGMPSGTVFEGHVEVAKAKTATTPGVLGFDFDRMRRPDGRSFAVHGSTIGLDSKSVVEQDGRLVARPGSSNENLKYVGYGAGAGALLAIVTRGNLLTTTLIGGALGYLYGEIKKDPSKARDVRLAVGTRSGIRLTQMLSFRMPTFEN
jgi:hypothetical protein